MFDIVWWEFIFNCLRRTQIHLYVTYLESCICITEFIVRFNRLIYSFQKRVEIERRRNCLFSTETIGNRKRDYDQKCLKKKKKKKKNKKKKNKTKIENKTHFLFLCWQYKLASLSIIYLWSWKNLKVSLNWSQLCNKQTIAHKLRNNNL